MQRFNLFADYFQFYLQDEAASGDLSAAWTEEAVARLLAVAPGTVGIGTVRNMEVPVSLEIFASAPPLKVGTTVGGWFDLRPVRCQTGQMESDQRPPITIGIKLWVAAIAGLVGGVVAALPVTSSMGQDKPLGLLVVELSFIMGPFAMLIPALLIAAGAAVGSAIGFAAVSLVDSWQSRRGNLGT